MDSKNNYEYARGIITASILWVGFVFFILLMDPMEDLIKWGIHSKIWSSVLWISFLVIVVILLVRLGLEAYNKLTRNRFKYFPTEKLKQINKDRNAT